MNRAAVLRDLHQSSRQLQDRWRSVQLDARQHGATATESAAEYGARLAGLLAEIAETEAENEERDA